MRSIDFFLSWKSFLVFSCIVFSAKIIFSAYNNFSAEFFEDWKIADNLAHHGVYAWHMEHGSSAYKLPVYPFFLSVFIKTFGDLSAIKVIIIVQHFLYFLLPILIIKIFDCFQLKAAGFLAAYFFIFSPAYFYYSNILEATNLFILLFCCLGIFLFSIMDFTELILDSCCFFCCHCYCCLNSDCGCSHYGINDLVAGLL